MSSSSTRPRGNMYVTTQGLVNLKANYKYTGADKSIVAAKMQVWWNMAVNWLPLWMAPNLVTLLGFAFIIVSYLLSAYYSPYLTAPAPTIVYLFHAFAVFAYQTLDALDGKQARRTKTSSALGELFDHGCDAVTTTLMAITCLSSMQVETGWYAYFLILVSNVVFFFAQWEQYNVGTLTLGYINVTEAQFAVMGVHLISAFFGAEFWNSPVPILGISYNTLVPMSQLATIGYTIFNNVVDVRAVIAERKLEPVSVYTQIIPPLACAVFTTLWIVVSPSRVLFSHPQAFFLMIGFMFPNLVVKIRNFKLKIQVESSS
eukprot:TRINITY_DN2572_c0_g1_i2.p1 TRINITY_DN2572_c0_g1~~TRINITY_DN2572_c0_g1_i2.p1  ORF type:complete len:316 (-),score=78.95 TRINITY_DN2572_c0_g1_i2:127-1074(-)